MQAGTKASKPNSRKYEMTVYLPSKKMKEEWQSYADKYMMSASRFIIHAVDSYITQMAKENAGIERSEMARMLRELEEMNRELKEENHRLKLLSRGLEKELAMVRLNSDPNPDTRQPDRRLIYALKNRGSLTTEEIKEVLGIEFTADDAMMTRINSDLEALEEVGLVKFDGRRWRWNLA